MNIKTYYKESLSWNNGAIFESDSKNTISIPFWFFENQFEQLKGKNIDKIQFIIDRTKHSRTTEDFSIYLKYHNYNNINEAQNAIQYNNTGVPLSDWKFKVNIQSNYNLLYINIENGDLIDQINRGNVKGFALDNGDVNQYAEFNMIAVNIYYKN